MAASFLYQSIAQAPLVCLSISTGATIAMGTTVTMAPEKKVASSSSPRLMYLHLNKMQVMDKKLLSSRAGTRFAEGDPPLSAANHSTSPKKLKKRNATRNPLAAQARTTRSYDMCYAWNAAKFCADGAL